MGAILAKFSMPPSGKTMDGTKKSIGPKMMARTTSSLTNLTLIGSGVGVYGPQNWKKLEFYQYNCP